MLLEMLAKTLGFVVVLGLLLFLPAGTVAWPRGWIFLALFVGCSTATGLWLRKVDPALYAARSASPLSRGQTMRDRVVILAILIGFAAWVVVMALDAVRFRWSATPDWAAALGAGLILAAFAGWIGVLRANSFAAVTVRLQPERGQTVISSGPYAVVRHPMYAYAVLLMIGAPLLLGSLWGLLGMTVLLPLLGARLLSEEAMLRNGLAGYRDYAARVRFRLVPGIW